MEQYADELAAIMKRFDDDTSALAERIRTEVVAPACRRHRLQFKSGMGTYFFCKKSSGANGPFYHDRDGLDDPVPYGERPLSDATKAALGPILDLLNKEATPNLDIGHLISDVD